MTQVLTPGTQEFTVARDAMMAGMLSTANGASMAMRAAWRLGHGDPVNEWNACFQLTRFGFTWAQVMDSCG